MSYEVATTIGLLLATIESLDGASEKLGRPRPLPQYLTLIRSDDKFSAMAGSPKVSRRKNFLLSPELGSVPVAVELQTPLHEALLWEGA